MEYFETVEIFHIIHESGIGSGTGSAEDVVITKYHLHVLFTSGICETMRLFWGPSLLSKLRANAKYLRRA